MDSTTYLNRYQLSLDQNGAPVALHRGASGVTYRAEDIETDQPVAVKLMPTYAFEAAELQQLEGEAQAARKVEHPNIARLYDFGLSGGDVVFVTELLDGTTLDAWVAEHGPLPASAVLRIAMQVVSGLAAAAFHSVIHRALQPANLMIVPGQTPDGEWPFVKVLNFGGVPPTLSSSAVSFGQGGPSPQFAAPEQLEGKPADFRSELYSLGSTMWFLLTGVMPTPGAVDKEGKIPKAMRPLLAQLVAHDPMQRPQDPTLLQEQIGECLARIEHRGPIGRAFTPPVAVPPAVAPVVAPSAPVGDAPAVAQFRTTTPQRALLKPLALAAAVLLLAGLAALALPHIHFRSADSEPIGVPVGVPQASAAAPARTSNGAVASSKSTSESTTGDSEGSTAPENVASAEATRAPSTAPAEAATDPTAARPAAIVSVPAAEPPGSDADQTTAPAVADGTARPATLAANDTPSDNAASNNSSPDNAASNNTAAANDTASSDNSSANNAADAEPAAPAEGPSSRMIAAATPAPVELASEDSTDDAPTPAASKSSSESSRSSRTTASVKPPVRSKSVISKSSSDNDEANNPEPAKATTKHSSRVAKNETRRAEHVSDEDLSGAPPVPRGATRARYLGTTPGGDLIFGLPSNERGFVAPPKLSRAERRRARRAQQVGDAPAAERALPAEPIGPDDR